MKTYEGKSFSEALDKAASDLGTPVAVLKGKATVISQKKGLFSTTVTIGIFNEKDVFEFASSYLGKLLSFIGADGTYTCGYDPSSSVLTVDVKTKDGSKVIGKNGETLKALNTLVRSACFNRFGGKYRILLNCGDYKEIKYAKLINLARRLANDVERSGVPASLNPMSADERRVVHNALLEFPNLESPSVGEGKERHIIIQRRLTQL